jgi:hypothetical protein
MPAGITGILYDAFHFIACSRIESSIAPQECALAENASTHDGVPFAFPDRIPDGLIDPSGSLQVQVNQTFSESRRCNRGAGARETK